MPKKLWMIAGAAVSALAMSSMLLAPAHAANMKAEQDNDQVEAKAPTTIAWPETQTTNRSTVATATTKLGTVKLRTGYYQGAQYGWAETNNSHDVNYIALDVDTDGDRIPNSMLYNHLRDTWTSPGYKTSASSNRAFRACVKHNPKKPCHPSYTTGWW